MNVDINAVSCSAQLHKNNGDWTPSDLRHHSGSDDSEGVYVRTCDLCT